MKLYAINGGEIDNRIKTIHKENEGLSSARNAGLEVCRGKYITFVDSDDFVDNDFISFLYNLIIENNVEIVCCESYIYYNMNNIQKKKNKNVEIKFNNVEALKYLNIIDYFNCGAWCKLYNRRIFENIRFPIGKKSEDLFVMPEIIYSSNGVYFSSIPKYYYRQREDSITHSAVINYDFIEAAENNIKFCKEKNVEIALPYAIQFYALACIGIYNSILCRTDEKIKMLEIRNKVLKIKNTIIMNDMNMVRKIQFFLFIHNINLYNIIFKLYNKNRLSKLNNKHTKNIL